MLSRKCLGHEKYKEGNIRNFWQFEEWIVLKYLSLKKPVRQEWLITCYYFMDHKYTFPCLELWHEMSWTHFSRFKSITCVVAKWLQVTISAKRLKHLHHISGCLISPIKINVDLDAVYTSTVPKNSLSFQYTFCIYMGSVPKKLTLAFQFKRDKFLHKICWFMRLTNNCIGAV